MDPVLELQRQVDEQRFAEADPVRLTIREMLMMVHTGMPGIVQSFNRETQTAVVQPAIQRLIVGESEPVTLPVCPDVPVFFPGGGGYVLTLPVAQGDECLLQFSERAIDFWFDRGGVQQPSEVRTHDLSDGFAFVGFRSKPNFIAGGVAAGGCELRAVDGSICIRIDGNSVTMGGPSGAPPPLPAAPFPVMLASTDFLAWLTSIATFASIPLPTGVPGPDFVSLKVRAT
jgi:hypothetical protein